MDKRKKTNIVEHEKTKHSWEGEEVMVESETKLEADTGTGPKVILRTFEFASNPQAFKQRIPTSQELFNHHLKGMQGMLWSDGLKPMEEIEPRLIFSKNKKGYRIFIACKPLLGQVVLEKPQTLSEIAHGNTPRN